MSAAQPLPISPGATLDIKWGWTGWLTNGETITARQVTAVPPLVKVGDSLDQGVVAATVTAPERGSVPLGWAMTARCTITTNQGRTDTRLYLLILTDR